MASRLGVFIEKHRGRNGQFFLSILVAHRLSILQGYPLKHFSYSIPLLQDALVQDVGREGEIKGGGREGGREKGRWEVGERKGGRREREREVRGREKGRWGDGERQGGGGGGGGGGGRRGGERQGSRRDGETQRERSSLTYTRQCGKGTSHGLHD